MTAVLATLVAAAAILGAVAARRAKERLPSEGILGEVLTAAEIGGRLAAVAALAQASLVVLPPLPSSLAPYATIGLALAVGWSVRDLLPDAVAWLVLLGRQRVRPGCSVRGPDFAGRVERVGLFATTLSARRGERITVPNRRFVDQSLTVADDAFAPVEVEVPLPGVPTAVARHALREAVFLSPWLAPDPAPEIGADPARPDVWRVRVALVEPRFADPFFGSFSERVHEVLREGSTPAPRAE